jgi:hypothetical protein
MSRFLICDRFMLRDNITLAQCETEWKDIEGLCRRQPLGKRDWRSDVGYGLMDIYLDVAGLPRDYCPDANVMHGLFLGMTDQWYRQSEANFRSVPILIVHNEPDREHIQRVLGPAKKVLVAPHPFHYIIQHYESEEKPERSGSVFFFPHSLGQPIPLIPVDYTMQKLSDLPIEYHPIDICLHVADVNKTIISKIKSYGFGLVSCGHRHDPRFLHRFYWICQRRRYAINTDTSTQLWLSTLAGCDTVLLQDIPTIFMMPASSPWDYFEAARENYWPLLDALATQPIDQAQIKKLVGINTGIDHWKSADQLVQIFAEAHTLYLNWKTEDGCLVLPPSYWHFIEPVLHKYRAYRNAFTNLLSGNRGRWTIVERDQPLLLMKYRRACNEAKRLSRLKT